MAVFRLAVLHEDDALRPVRAADEMRHALPEERLGHRRCGEGGGMSGAAAQPGHVLA